MLSTVHSRMNSRGYSSNEPHGSVLCDLLFFYLRVSPTEWFWGPGLSNYTTRAIGALYVAMLGNVRSPHFTGLKAAMIAIPADR